MSLELTSYLLGKKAGGGGSTINNQDKTLTENGQYTADSGYTGLGTVTVNVPEPTGNINITDTNQTNVKNYATAQVVDADLVAGNIKKDVNILGVVGTYEGSGGDISEYFNYTLQQNIPNAIPGWAASIKKLVTFNNHQGTSMNQAFAYFQGNEINFDFSTSNVGEFYRCFYNCEQLLQIPNNLDTSNGTTFQDMFYFCKGITTIPQLNTSNGTNFSQMFSNCQNLTTIPQLNTSNGTNFQAMFYNTYQINNIPELDLSKCTNIYNFIYNQTSQAIITNFGGCLNLGQAYDTTKSANFYAYALDLSRCPNLTHESLMNVINKLYDIATAGCNAQSLVLGATNLAKLTAEEISTCTSKGWSIS